MKARFVFVILIVLALAACTSVQRSSTPFWEEEYQKQFQSISGKQDPSLAQEEARRAYADRVNGWPIYYQLGESMSVLWPFFMKSPAGHALFPIYEYAHKAKRLSMLCYLIGVYDKGPESDSGHYVFPLYAWNKSQSRSQLDYLLLGKSTIYKDKEARHSFFPLFWYSNDPEEKRFSLQLVLALLGIVKSPDSIDHWLLPLWHYGSSENRFHFYSLPFWYDKNQDRRAMGLGTILYIDSTEGDHYYRSLLWPLSHFWNGEDSKGQFVFPLYGMTNYKDGGWMFNSLLYNRYRSAEEKDVVNIGGPLYHRAKTPEGWYTSFLWPIFHAWENEEKSGTVAFPLFFYGKNKEKESTYLNILGLLLNRHKSPESEFFFTPLFGYGKDKNTSWFNLLLAAFHTSKSPQRRDVSLLAGIIDYSDDKNNGKEFSLNLLLPLLKINRNSFFTWLGGYTNEIPKEAELRNLLVDRQETMQRRMEQIRKEQPDSPMYVAEWRGYNHWHFLLLAHGFHGVKYRIHPEREVAENPEPLWEEDNLFVFPLYFQGKRVHADGGRNSWNNILGLIWHSSYDKEIRGDKEDVKARRRFLWKVVDYRRENQRSVMDIFPFMTFDRDREIGYSRFSFLGPVFRKTRQGEQKQTQIFGITFGDAIKKESE
ncbi:MAG: hypothetical protein ACLFQ6_08885 [Candidatus Sumerlaeia bacterium]